MHPNWLRNRRWPHLLKLNSSRKFFLFLAAFACTYVLWAQYLQYDFEFADEEAVDHTDVYRTNRRSNLKYILLWSSPQWSPFYELGRGQRGFISQKCSIIDCYITSNKNFFAGDLTKFHAIAFNGRILKNDKAKLPKVRSPHQKYIYMNMESADNFPMCSDIFDGFFNWTATYRLDSDIQYSYITIKNKTGKVVGPQRNMIWQKNMSDIDEELKDKLMNKSLPAAWFVSHCSSRSYREKFYLKLFQALSEYNLKIDVYGDCGEHSCPRSKQSECNAILERDYYFYMSLENSFAEDYVTEKLLTALQHNMVPIVYGGANYSRFLPPNSYIDGNKHTAEELASIMFKAIRTPETYFNFFKWKRYYTYHDQSKNLCRLCEALNNRTKFEAYSSYDDFRSWWNVEKDPKHCYPWFSWKYFSRI